MSKTDDEMGFSLNNTCPMLEEAMKSVGPRKLVASSEQATRYNQGKPQYSMIDLNCLEPCANVLEFGAKKYARDNWKKGMDISKILDSLLRHIARLQAGEYIDPESGLPHIGHIQCNALFLGNRNNTPDLEFKDLSEEELNAKYNG